MQPTWGKTAPGRPSWTKNSGSFIQLLSRGSQSQLFLKERPSGRKVEQLCRVPAKARWKRSFQVIDDAPLWERSPVFFLSIKAKRKRKNKIPETHSRGLGGFVGRLTTNL